MTSTGVHMNKKATASEGQTEQERTVGPKVAMHLVSHSEPAFPGKPVKVRGGAKTLDLCSRLADAFRHPIRAQIYLAILEGPRAPSDLAPIFGRPVSYISQQVQRLVELDLVAESSAEPAKNNLTKTYYRSSNPTADKVAPKIREIVNAVRGEL